MSNENGVVKQIAQRLKQAHELISEAMVLISNPGSDSTQVKASARPLRKVTNEEPDFSMPIRPFVKKNAVGMNGARKFALLVAYLAKGNEQQAVALAEVESHWNKMTDKSLLGMKFNRLYSSEAKNEDWVHSPAKGAYHLRPDWKAIFE